jgi:hypothetical protein
LLGASVEIDVLITRTNINIKCWRSTAAYRILVSPRRASSIVCCSASEGARWPRSAGNPVKIPFA